MIAGFVIERCGTMLVEEDAGILVRSRGNRIVGNQLRDILFGVYLFRGAGTTVSGNTITGRRHLEPGQRGSGIHVYDSPRNILSQNTITDVRDGIYIQNANHTQIEGNRVFDVRYGLHYMYADSNTFLRNRFENSTAGAAIMYTRGIVMRHNVFSRNRSFSAFGVLLQDCHGLTADSNIIADNVIGLFLENSQQNRFRHNVIAKNDLAMQMFQNAERNTFTENSFIDNLSPLVIVGKRTGSRWAEGGRGNYWSAYGGYDLDGDGIGDVPMQIQNVFQYLEGRNSAVRLYLYSPASQALATASSAFPVMRVAEESDPHPLMEPPDLRGMPSAVLDGGGERGGLTGAARAAAATPLALLAVWWLMRRAAGRAA
jgi:nitrous oxidase accessory protein